MLVVVLAWRVYDSLRAPALERWHTFVPAEASAEQIAKLDWAGYLEVEKKLFEQVRTEVTDKLDEEDRIDSNRYFAGSPIYPGRFAQDWNRSYVLAPAGTPVGAVVLLHGLTDSPYSLRHVARRYVQAGYVAVAIRLPGHGTVPAGLAKVEWEQWMAATHLAVREARRLAPAPAPLHVIGFSNGGALAMKYALDALDDPGLTRPERIVLFAPMIGITSTARFAGVFGWPALASRPSTRRRGWASCPSSTPSSSTASRSTARASPRWWRGGCRRRSTAMRVEDNLKGLAPVLTFQSVVDFTVSTRAIVAALYAKLPANGSELVLFDLNRNARFGPLLRRSTDTVVARLLPDAPRNFRTTVVTNAGRGSDSVVARTVEAGATTEQMQRPGAGLSARRVLAVAPGDSVPAERPAVRPGARHHRGLRRQPGRDGHARRTRHAHRQHRFAGAHVLEPLLRLS